MLFSTSFLSSLMLRVRLLTLGSMLFSRRLLYFLLVLRSPLGRLRSMLLSRRLLHPFVGLLPRLLNLMWSLRLALRSLSLPLHLVRSLVLLNLGSLLVLLLPLISQFLSLLWWPGLVVLDIPRSVPFPMSILLPASPILLQL